MKLSLVLATVGRTDHLERFFATAAQQRHRDFEVVLVDQNDDDRLNPYVARAAAAGIAVSHIRLRPANLSAARNLGLRHAAGDVVGFPDDDCWYEPNTLADVVTGFGSGDTRDGVVARWVEQAEGNGMPPTDGLLELDAWRRFRGGDASSISLFLRRALLLRQGGFDERLGVGQYYGAGEETDLLLRALTSGARIAHCSAARVHHRYAPATSLAAAPGGVAALLRRSRGTGALYAKHALPLWVIARGLIAPPLRAVGSGRGWREAGFGLAQTWGRLSGMLRWHLREGRTAGR